MINDDKLKMLKNRIMAKLKQVYSFPKNEYAEGYVGACKAVLNVIYELEQPGEREADIKIITRWLKALRDRTTDQYDRKMLDIAIEVLDSE